MPGEGFGIGFLATVSQDGLSLHTLLKLPSPRQIYGYFPGLSSFLDANRLISLPLPPNDDEADRQRSV